MAHSFRHYLFQNVLQNVLEQLMPEGMGQGPFLPALLMMMMTVIVFDDYSAASLNCNLNMHKQQPTDQQANLSHSRGLRTTWAAAQ